MRIAQLIDSLDAGGAERMAVSLANEWAFHGHQSYVCVTRKEGTLKGFVSKDVGYHFLGKQSSWDVRSFRKLLRWVRQEKIEVLHAHSSSFFFGYGIKLCVPGVKLIWHDHYGNSEMLNERSTKGLRWCSRRFDAIISVNVRLKEWSEQQLKCPSVHYIKNFVSAHSVQKFTGEILGNGETKIVCLANLRPQKDHLTLLKAFKTLQEKGRECSLHLAGKHWHDAYYESIQSFMKEQAIQNVHFYGSITGALSFLKHHDLAVLSSESEGLPVALLEYGMAGLPVVATQVGQVPQVLSGNGKLVVSKDADALAAALEEYILDPDLAKSDAQKFAGHVAKEYTFLAVKEELMEIYGA